MKALDRPRITAPRRRFRAAEPTTPTRSAAMCNMAATARAVPALRRFARDNALRWAAPEDTIDALSLVVTELVTNVVLHSGSPDITVFLACDNRSLTVEVKDGGHWQARRGPRLSSEDADADCGRGLDLVKACTGWWLAYLSATGTRVVANLPFAAATV